MIFEAREPRNTRSRGPAVLDPTTRTSPSVQSTSASASAQSCPRAITAASVRGATGSPATSSSTRRCSFSMCATHSSTTASSMCGPTAIVRGGAGRTANDAIRRTAPTRTATRRGDHQIGRLGVAGEGRRHPRDRCAGVAPVPARHQRHRHRASVQQVLPHTAQAHATQRAAPGRSDHQNRRRVGRRLQQPAWDRPGVTARFGHGDVRRKLDRVHGPARRARH